MCRGLLVRADYESHAGDTPLLNPSAKKDYLRQEACRKAPPSAAATAVKPVCHTTGKRQTQ